MQDSNESEKHIQVIPDGIGFVYDEAMTKHCCITDPKHPEGPHRVSLPYAYLKERGHLDGCVRIPSRFASDEELQLVHAEEYIKEVKSYTSHSTVNPCKIPERWPTYESNGAFNSASCAVGCSLNMLDAVMTDQVKCGIALVRPPGHHAEVRESCGFCFFNTVAITAKYAQMKYDVKKILILDWDIHHGNGIQHIFYNDPSVLYISLHRFDNGDYFPHLKESSADAIGDEEGKGFNVNIPWNKDMMGNSEYKVAFERIIIPIINQFQPQLTLVASGFDAAAADPLGEYVLTPEMYGYMTKRLESACGGRLVVITEGGYNANAIGESLAEILQVLQGTKNIVMDLPDCVPGKRAEQTIQSVMRAQSKFWKFA